MFIYLEGANFPTGTFVPAGTFVPERTGTFVPDKKTFLFLNLKN